MSSLNKVMLIGNLGRDPEVRSLPNGGRVVNLTVATSESWKDKSTGERKEKTEWHRVVIFNDRLGEIAEKYLKKGSKVYIEGALQTRKWTGTDGNERYTTEIVLSQFKGEIGFLGGSQEQNSGTNNKKKSSDVDEIAPFDLYGRHDKISSISNFDDEIPF